MELNDLLSRDTWANWWRGIVSTVLGRQGRYTFVQPNYTMYGSDQTLLVDKTYSNLMSLAVNVPHLNVVISKGAEMFANAHVRHVNKEGEDIENSPLLKLLNNPNLIDNSLEDFLYKFYVYNAVFGNSFCFKNKGSMLDGLPKFIWWLPSGEMKVIATGKMYRQVDISGIIKQYERYGEQVPYTPEEIILIRDGVPCDEILSTSKLVALQLPLSNIMAALKSYNIITKEKGSIGMIAADGSSSDGAGAIPMDKDMMKRDEDDYQRKRGLDSERGHVTFTSNNVKWIPMTFDVGQLKLFEGLEDAFGNICGGFGIDRDIFPSTKGATNENKKQGVITTYQNTMQPLLDKLLNKIAHDFGLDLKGEKLIGEYDWLPIMQEDETKRQTAEKIKAETLALMVDKGIISRQTFAQLMDVELTGTPQAGSDSLGKIPLALQQLALARERANTANDTALSLSIGQAMDNLTAQLVNVVIGNKE